MLQCRCVRRSCARRGTNSTRVCGDTLQLDFALFNDSFEACIVLEKAIAGEAEKIIAEVRVPKVDLEQSVITDGQHSSILYAFDGCSPFVIGRKKAKFSHETSRRKFNANFSHQIFSCGCQKHLFGCLSFPKQDIPFAVVASVHKRLEPVHCQIALHRDPRLLNEFDNLEKTQTVDGQQ